MLNNRKESGPTVVDRQELAGRVAGGCRTVRQKLLDARNDKGHWVGQLSCSALATATAISALSQYRDHSIWPIVSRPRIQEMIDRGIHWLLSQQNLDGGWGDTDRSHSNVATSMLVRAALQLSGNSSDAITLADQRANAYVEEQGNVEALRRRYGKDKTFAVPILANCAIAGQISWKEVSALPFEAVVVPQGCYRFINLPVVSYAIPALVAIGQAKYVCDPPRNPLMRLIRMSTFSRAVKVLTRMQPSSGGFLEAIPLTCFVAMSLAHTGRADHEVTRNCIQFVEDSFREEGDGGTWPIDTNLATWNTTLSINALSESKDEQHLAPELLDWLLACQYKTVHPFTGAEPGGWGWSDLSGAVPDADDTPGALLALRNFFDSSRCTAPQKLAIQESARAGVLWLLKLQNRDKGWPTFCRGWGRLPFDRSGNDITAHVIRALLAWKNEWNDPGIEKAIEGGFGYLRRNSLKEGGWHPLWFGNQDHAGEENPVYGTVKVLHAWHAAKQMNQEEPVRAVKWLLAAQNDDGGWGGGPSNRSEHPGEEREETIFSSVQETSLALDLFAGLLESGSIRENAAVAESCLRGTIWLVEAVESGKFDENWPIGFYFAKLWYYESLYPLVFCVSALTRLDQWFAGLSVGDQDDLDRTGSKIPLS